MSYSQITGPTFLLPSFPKNNLKLTFYAPIQIQYTSYNTSYNTDKYKNYPKYNRYIFFEITAPNGQFTKLIHILQIYII